MGKGEEGHPRGLWGGHTPSEPRKHRSWLRGIQRQHDEALEEAADVEVPEEKE